MKPISFSSVEEKIIVIRDVQVIVDNDVAMLYGVETKRINEAVKNNPDKFPEGYIITIEDEEKEKVVENFDHLNSLKFSHAPPKAFSEKGLYMLATILKSHTATQTTIAIVEAFAKLRELTRNVAELAKKPEEISKKTVMQRSGAIISDLLGDALTVTEDETTIELNLALFNVKHTVKRKKR